MWGAPFLALMMSCGATLNGECGAAVPLVYAADEMLPHCVRTLLAARADPNVRCAPDLEDGERFGSTPLECALVTYHSSMYFPPPPQHAQDDYDDDDVLQERLAIVNALIGARADVNAPDPDGNTPLWWALRYRNTAPVIHVLLDAGAKMGPCDLQGCEGWVGLLFLGRRHFNRAYATLWGVLRRRVRVRSGGYPRGWPLPLGLVRQICGVLWESRTSDVWYDLY
jgi:hypothetical protein